MSGFSLWISAEMEKLWCRSRQRRCVKRLQLPVQCRCRYSANFAAQHEPVSAVCRKVEDVLLEFSLPLAVSRRFKETRTEHVGGDDSATRGCGSQNLRVLV